MSDLVIVLYITATVTELVSIDKKMMCLDRVSTYIVGVTINLLVPILFALTICVDRLLVPTR